MKLQTYTGGIFDTNAFFLEEYGILVDAPQGAAEWLRERGISLKTLLLTHGHIDHTWDAAELQRDHDCAVFCHAETVPMITEPDFFTKLGFMWEVQPVTAPQVIEEAVDVHLGGLQWQVLLVPGHCPGSLCFYRAEEQLLFGGDVLFAGSVGRCDLPGGDWDLLERGIKTKIFPLGDEVTVLPGHGPATKIGVERRTNPYVGG